MLHAIGVLGRARFTALKNAILRGKRSKQASLAVAGGAGLLCGFLIYTWVRSLVVFARSGGLDRILRAAQTASGGAVLPLSVPQLLLTLPSALFFAALVVLLLTGLSSALTQLFLSRDIERLIVAPVPVRAVFIVILLEALLPAYLLLFGLVGPALVGYGQGMGFGAGYFVALLFALLLFPLLPTSLGVLVVLGLVRVLPPRSIRTMLSVVGGALSVGFYLFFNVFNRSRLAGPQTIGALSRVDLPFLPSAWAGRGLVALGTGDTARALAYGVLYVVPSLVVFGLSVLLAERLYYEGWEGIVSTQGGRRRARATKPADRTPARLVRLDMLLLPAQSAAILRKDLRTLVRNPQYLQQLITTVIIGGAWVYLLFARNAPAERSNGAFLERLSDAGTVGVALMMCYFIASKIGVTAVSREGRSFWLLQIAPVSGMQVLLGKLALTFLPYLALGAPFVAALALFRGGTSLAAARDVCLLLLAGVGCSALLVGLGAAYPRLDWRSPQQQASARAGCLGGIGVVIYCGVVVATALGPALLGASVLRQWTFALETLGLAVALAVTAVVGLGALRFGAHRLEQIEDT
jgi:hypothetical protein